MGRKEERAARRRQELIEKMRSRALRSGKVDLATLPEPLRIEDGKRLVRVFVEGYEDVAFWRGIFDHFTNPYLRFESSVPTREDLPKGKKVLLKAADRACEDMLLCMDSDFDYLLAAEDATSQMICSSPYMFHTYAYATENYLCYAPSLHNVCVKATKNDTRIFEFEQCKDILGMLARRIDVPQKQRIDCAGVVGHKSLEIKYARIVFGRLHADVV